ncbi:MAG: hypothetical protein MJ240_09100 [Kiritimatiellae bacterium]|nr:hypothetical protein [Kiritimatiellia bacterium]
MKTKLKFFAFAALAAACSVRAMTYGEFTAAIEAAPDGGTVYLENDVEYTAMLPSVAKRVTLASPEGQTNVLRRAASYTSRLLSVEDAAADITLRDIVIDGNKEAGACSVRVFSVTNGVLTLESGATIRNYNFGRTVGGIGVIRDGTLNMREGATICDCDYAPYAMLMIGVREKGLVRDGHFVMTGGRITRCAGHYTTATPVADFDGVVYLYSQNPEEGSGLLPAAVFDMSGGEITGNTSENACAGVCVVCGTWNLSGTARIIGNKGGMVDDIHNTRGKILVEYGYAGRATFYSGSTTEPTYQGKVSAAKLMPAVVMAHFKGGENISNQHWPKWVLCSDYSGAYSTFYWEPLLAMVNEQSCISLDHVRDRLRESAGSHCDICFARSFTNAYSSAMLTIPADSSCSVRGWPGESISWHRGNNASSYFALLQTNAAIRVENLILDGDGDVMMGSNKSMFNMYEYGCAVTLGQGAVITNVDQATGVVIAGMGSKGQHLTIEEGAVITDCAVQEAAGYGALIRVGTGTELDPPPRLDMTGGVITNCRSGCTSASTGGYGGMLYVQKGVFNMSGGVIAGNTCGDATSGSCAGVQVYQGETYLSGTARIENNFGKNPDLFRSGTAKVTITGDFRGSVGLSSGNQAEGQETIVKIDPGATGAWCLHPAANGVASGLVGTPSADGTKVKWKAAIGAVDGASVATLDDARALWPAEQTSEIPSHPHLFSGETKALDCAWNLDFDAEALKAAYVEPIVLAQAEDGAFTGTWSFVTPAVSHARWAVRSTYGAAGITAWRLELLRRGTQVFFR